MASSYFRKIILPLVVVFIIAFLWLAVFVHWDKKTMEENKRGNGKIVFESALLSKGGEGKVLGEEESGGSRTLYESGNYRVPQVIIGSEGGIYYPGAEEQKELAISDVRSEIFTDKDKKNKKILLMWNTNKPTKSVIEYGKVGAAAVQTYEEIGYSLEHSVLLGPLDSSTTYEYVITMRDRGGATSSTDKFAVYTGAPQVSFLDLLTGAFKGIFGWAMK